MSGRKPAISVCIPVYNGERHLVAAIRSVLNQTFRDFELLIIDDCSTDASLRIAESFSDSRLRIIRNDHNFGLVGNFNKCVALARRKYSCILPQDDIILPERLQVQHELMAMNPRIGYVHSAFWIVDGTGRAYALRKPFQSDHVWTGLQAFKIHALGNMVGLPTVLVRSESYSKVGPFDPNLLQALDWDMWLRIELAGYCVAYVARPLACYRFGPKHASQTALAFRNPSWLVNEEFKVIKKTFLNPYVRERIASANFGMNSAIAERVCNSLIYWPIVSLHSRQNPIGSMLQSVHWFLIARKLGLVRLTIRSIVLGLVRRFRQQMATRAGRMAVWQRSQKNAYNQVRGL